MCRLCVENPAPDKPPPRVYDSRDALLRDHLFEPRLDWVNGSLAKADAVGLFQDRGMRWARLLTGETEDRQKDYRVHRFPVR